MIGTKEFKEFIAFLGFFYLVPILLLYFGYLPFHAFRIILIVVGIILIAYSIDKKIPPEKLGFRKDNLSSSLLLSLGASITGLVILAVIWKLGIIPNDLPNVSPFAYLFYIIVSVPIQEYIFRSLMFYELDLFIPNKRALMILVSALVYSSAHLMFKNSLVLVSTFIVGIMWGWMYEKHPNFWGVTVSHMVLGTATVMLGS